MEKTFAQALPAGAMLAYPMPLPTFDAEDVELLRHYATQSSLTLSPRDTLSLFQVNVPGEAKTHLFLMHSVLAFSALHLSCVNKGKRDQYIQAASRQHQQALTSFRESVSEVNIDNCGAITAFSFLTVVYTLGLPIVFGFSSTPSPAYAFLDVLQVLRRAWSAIGPALIGVEKGKLRELIRPIPSKRRSCPMHAKGGRIIRFLEQYLESSPIIEPEYRHIYRQALAHWEHFFLNMPCKPPLWANALVWPMTVSSAFFELLMEKRPFPMILIAVWSIALDRAPNMWFNAWGKRIIGDIWDISDEEMKEALVWPAEVVGVIPPKFHPEGCVCWSCREGDHTDPTLLVRDAAAAVLVDRTVHG
ncbi:hypothetical protein BU26DRAFT_70686 [Trematosphaeria pertusa]|uniref:C6 zinc finger domain-containing protein n=1 Tax=Trematosphaeria pertusa TaxID=390896 RepID=A0A6A6I4S9_9PLEO|nr:uncharacterized protein BU26DRAFT_70686 [Trematosphaeria pertusa]KAF2245534.1 hypothetical protein BU26DRAFT_70686 [Trematosphaeria pertusa]